MKLSQFLFCLLFTGLVVSSTTPSMAQVFTNNIVDYGDGSSNVFSTLQIGPDGKIYCMWKDGNASGIMGASGPATYKLIRWNTTTSAWDSIGSFAYTDPGGINTSFGIGDDIPFDIDSAGGFHVAFIVPPASPLGNAVYYAYSANGTSWAFTQLVNFTATNDSPGSLDLFVDPSNRPHVFFKESNVGTGSGPPWTSRVWTVWHYFHNGTAWQSEPAYSQNGGSGTSPNEVTAIASTLDSNGKGHVVFCNEINGGGTDAGVAYVTNAGGSWSALQQLATGATGAAEGVSVAIVTDANNKAHIIRRGTDFKMHYHTNVSGSFTDTWMNGNLLGNIKTAGRPLTVNSLGDIFCAYNGQTVSAGGNPGIVRYACLFGGTGSTWQIGDVMTTSPANTRTGQFISAAFTSSRLAMTTFDHFTNPQGTGSPAYSPTNNPRQLQYATATVSPPGAAPTVTTDTQTSVTATSATLGGNVTNDGGASVTERGIVWKTSTGPTTADNKVQNGSGTGAFSATVGSLPAGTTVFVRAYAINSVNTSYGSEISFTTLSNNADLSALSTTATGMSPAFSAGTTAYTASVPNGTTSVTVTATRAQANATLQVQVNSGGFSALTSGSASGALALNVGANTIDVKVTAQDGTTIKTYTITVTRLPALSINDVTAAEGNAGTTSFTFTVSLSAAAPAGGVSFNISTADGTATQPGDYTLKSLTAQTIPAGSSTYSFTVLVNGDATNEPGETFFVNVTSVTGATVSDGQGVGTITNDDPLPSLSINSPSVNEGNSGTTTLTFTATLSAASGQTVTVNYATTDGTATTGNSDYVATSGSLSFAPGQTTRTFTVTINGDTAVETNETFTATLSGATNATISTATGTGTITNDDVAPDVPMTLTGGSLGIDASSSAGAANTILRFVTGPGGPFLEIFDATRTLGAPAGGTQVNANTVRIPIASLTGGITLTGSALADTFTLDFSAGDICPPGGISVVGGAPTTSPGDTLAIDGDFTSGGSYGTGSPGAGTLTLDSGNTVNFTGLEPVDLSAASFTDFTVTVDPGNAFVGNVITTVAAVDGGVNTNISFGASGLESTKLGVVTGTLTINGDNVEQDYFVLQGLGSAMAGHFVVDGRGGDSDVIEVNNTTFAVAGLNKNLSLKADFIGLGRVNAVSPADNPGVIVCSGNITLEADGDSSIATSTLWGVTNVWGTSVPAYFNAAQVPHTARGTIQVLGDIKKTAGADATLTLKAKHSIVMPNTLTTGPAGSIVSTSNKLHVIMNSDSDASGAGNVMLLAKSAVTTNGGDLTIGGGANPATTAAFGVAGSTTTAPGVALTSTVLTTSGGAVSILGTGAANSSGVGVLLNVTAGSATNGTISSGSGNVTITGTGGSNTTSTFGMLIQGNGTAPALDGQILTTTGNVTIAGTATAGNLDGVRLFTRGSIASSGGGLITLTAVGSGTNTTHFNMNPASGQTASVSSTGGNITIIADTMNLDGGAGTESITTGSSTSGTVTLKPGSAGKNISLGSGVVDSATQMAIDSGTELANVTAGTVTIGHASSGILSVSSVISPSTFTTLGLASGAGTTFSATSGFSSDVTSASVFEKITVAGTVTISAGATLATASAGGYIWNGSDAFTFLDNDAADAISGTFTGPTLTNYLGSTSTATQSYTGGTGNDLVISAPPSANADLATLTTTAGALSPVFAAGTTSYSTPAVLNATSSVTVTATRAQANATLQVRVNGGSFTNLTSGSASGALALNVGANTIDVKVTAQDGTTIKTYTISVTRNPPPAAPTLTSVSPSGGAVAGGATVVIVGRDFTGASAVKFGNTAATGFTVNSDTQITATVPAGSAGILDVSVTTGLGTGTGSGLFYYYATTGSTPAMAASKIDLFTPNGAGKVLPGAPIQYRTLIANTGNGNATTVDLADPIPNNTTLVAGSVNVSPLGVDDVYSTIVNTQLAAGSPTVLSGPLVTSAAKTTDNDREFLGDTFTISAFDATSANGGSVVMVTNGANMGSFTYVPAAGFVGADSFTYTLRDDGTDSTAGNADDLTGIGVVVINVVEADTVLAGTQKVWYIDNSYAGANGAENGTSARPFNALSDVSGLTGPDATTDTLYLATGSGNYTGGITLLVDQSLTGQNQALVLNGTTLAVAGTDPVIANSGGSGVTLATGNTLRGFTVGDTTGDDISGTTVGSLAISNVICNGTGGILRVTTSGALAVTLDSATTTSATNAVFLTGTTGTCTITTGAISGVTGDDFTVNGGTASVSYGGTISNSTQRSVLVLNKTGGTVTFSGQITDTAGSTGILCNANAGATINFSGGLSLTTTTNAAFTATGGGTVSVTGSANTITTTSGAALTVANTTIGASGLTFQSITAGTGAGSAGVGISLDTTGSSGGLTVTGTGTPGSGGTIQHKTGANLSRSNGIGIYLNNTAGVSLTRMQLNDFDNFAIRGFGVSGFTLANCVINGVNGNSTANLGGTDEAGEGSVYFGNAGVTNTDGLNGTVSIANSTITGGSARNLSIADTSSSSVMHATISGCTFGLTQNLLGGNQSLAVEARNAGTISHVSVTSSTFAGSMSDAMNFTGQTGTTMHVTVGGAGAGNTITNSHPANNLGGGSMVFATQGIMFFDARNNIMSGADGSAVTIFKAAAGTQMEGTFDSNTIGTSGVASSGSKSGNGIFVSAGGAGAIKLAVTNNIIQRYDGSFGFVADNTGGSYSVDLTFTGNTLRQPGTNAFGFGLTNGAPTGTETTNVFTRIFNNDFGDSSGAGAGLDILLGSSGVNNSTTHTFTLSGATAGDVANELAIEAFVKNNNNLNGASATTSVDAYADAPATFAAFKASASLPAPPGAPLPLLFAEKLPEMAPQTSLTSQAASTEKAAATVVSAPRAQNVVSTPETLTQASLEKLAAEAVARWEAAGLTETQKQRLKGLRFEISDLSTLHLGQASGDLIQISRTAAGNSWFIDETPRDDSEFESAIEGVDLLTTLMHEMGHTLGLTDRYDLRSRGSIMYGHLTRGERRLPAKGEAAGATTFTDDTQRFLGATITIGTLPPGKSVTVVGTVLVNDPANTQLISGQGTVSGGNFTTFVTDDPAAGGTTDPTTTPVERPDATVVSIATGTTPTNAASVSWTVTFNTAVSNVASANFALANIGLTAPSITGVTAVGGQPATVWTVTASTGTGSGTLGLNMANDAGSLSHDILNLPFTGGVYTIDKIAPVFTSITRQTPAGQNTNADTLTFRATFSEVVTGVDATDFTVSGTTATITGVTGTGPYDLTLSGGDLASLNGTVSLALAGAQNIADTAGNPLPGTAPATNETYTVDNTAPTVTIASTTGNPAANDVIPVTVTFSESVTGFDLTDITVTGGTKGNFAGTGAAYSFDLTPTGPGVTVTVDVAGSAAQDAAGNNNTAATQFTRTIVDSVSIAATTATAAEGGATGLYTFTRASSAGALTVSFQLDASSTATAATDFNLTSGGTLTFNTGTGAGTIVIPNGQLTATVTLTALTESPNPAEAAETARLNVVAGSGYVAGSPANVTVTITENSFLVTTTNDSGTGSLRQAVLNANSIAGTDTITFSDGTGGTVNFTDNTPETITVNVGGALLLSSSLIVEGPGADRLGISGNNATGVFSVGAGSLDVTVSKLSIINGSAPNRGGIASASAGVLRVTQCALSGNTTAVGAAILNNGPGSVLVAQSTISGNTASNSGGAISNFSTGSVTVVQCTLSGNNASSGNGGGINNASTGSITVLQSTVTSNTASGTGGGVRNAGAGVVTIANTIIAGNTGGGNPDVEGAFTSNGGNLIGNAGTATGFTNGTNSDQVGNGASPINPLLGALANNGGPTRTHALLAGSPALNAGLNAQIPADTFDLDGDTNTTEAIPFDQRGTTFTRAIGTVDIGAFELQKSVSIGNLAAISEGNSGTTNFVFTITRTGDTTGDVDMTYTVSGAAVNAADFGGSLPNGTATITNGNATGTVTIPVSGDTTVEPDEAFTVTLSAPDNGYVISGAPATSTINNDDAATVSIAKITDGAEANTPTNGKFRVTQTAASSTATTVSYGVSGTATSGTDFTALSGSVIIPAGNTTADIDVTVLNDGTVLEPTETVILTVNNVTSTNNVTQGSPATATMNLTDDDTATVTIAKITDGAETPTSAVFRVTQTAQATVDTVITYSTGGTATSGSDYTAPTGSVTILAGNTTADITVTITNDAIVEATETLSLTLTGFTARDADVSLGATLTATADITDNDTATVTIAKITDAAEPSTNGLFRVTQTAVSSTNTVVTYGVTGTAASGTDFTALSGSVTILAGNTTADISVAVIDENLVEASETVIATLNGFSARDADISLGATVAATVNITDNDTASVTLAKITDGVEAAVPTNAVFRVTQTNPASVDTVVTYSVGGTATFTFDYTGLTGFVTILAGNTTADITVAVLNENMVEPTETVTLTLNGFTARDPEVTLGATLNASADITDSDTSVITLAAVSADKNEGTGGASTAFTFSATLSNPVQGGFTIAYTTNDGTALAGSDYTDNDSTLNFTGTASESKTITVSVTHDGTNEIDETFTVALGSITGLGLGIPAGNVTTAGSPQTGTIRNDDALTITITAPDADADENTAGIGIWRVSRNGVLNNTTVQLQIDASSTAVPADWTQSGATFGSLAAGSTGTIVIPGGSTFVEFSLTPSADLHAEAAETVRVNVTTDPLYVVGSPSNATVTIGQNDFLVINTNNSGEGTLRQAVLNANALVGTDTITFSDGTGGTVNFTDATADTITLSGGEITLTSDLTIAGTGANVLVVQNTQAAGATSRVFNITNGLVRLRGLTITGGNATTDGGGIRIGATTNVTLVGCAVSGNSTTALGGGISSAAFNLSIVSSTISGNSAAGVNTAGGIHSTGATFSLLNSTVSGNSSTAATGNNAGGILGNGTMTNCTVTNNSVANPDPSIVGGVGGGFTVSNSLIAGNVANTTRPDIGGFFTSNGGNVIGNVGTATGFTATNDLKGTGAAPINPLLGALADNGGPTLTHILLNGSPAINNGLVANLPLDTFDLDGDTNVAEVLPVDQRGGVNLRQRGPAPDAGAVEAFAFEPTISASPAVNEDTQTTSGLVITANTADGGLTTHYQITGITAGTLYQNDGTTVIAENDFITKAQGTAGLKFTPSLNLNNTTTALFGFTVQAAVGTAAGDQRGATVSTTLSVNPVNDAPTVVAPGIPDQTVTVGTPVVVALPGYFADVELDVLGFSVTGNSTPAKATAAITGGTNVTLTALAYGETDVTIQANDGNGGTVTDTFRVFARTVDPTATMPPTPVAGWTFSPVNAMFNISVPVQNTTALAVNGMKLTVNVAAYLGAQPSLRLWNATRTTGPGIFEIDYPYPVASQATVTFSLIFYTSTRQLPNPFAPVLTVSAMPVSVVPGPLPAGLTFVTPDIRVNTVGRVVLEWPSTYGKWYRIYYNDGLNPGQWVPSATPIQAGSNRQQWSDEGAPFTATPPGAARFYFVTEVPAP